MSGDRTVYKADEQGHTSFEPSDEYSRAQDTEQRSGVEAYREPGDDPPRTDRGYQITRKRNMTIVCAERGYLSLRRQFCF